MMLSSVCVFFGLIVKVVHSGWSGRRKLDSGCRPCGGDRLGAAIAAEEGSIRKYMIPKSFATGRLPNQLVLIKVPETGSSTASNLLAELSERKGVAQAWQGQQQSFQEVILETPKKNAKWALGHQPWGDWITKSFDHPILITTARDPLTRVVSHTEKRVARKEIDCSTVSNCDCGKGLGVALRFWGCCPPGKRSVRHILSKYHHVWITERFNESLVLFAIRNQLQLGDVLPPLAKFHGMSKSHRSHDERRVLVQQACKAAENSDLKLEHEVHTAAVARLDSALNELRHHGVDIDDIIRRFNTYLQFILDFGSRLKPPRPLIDDTNKESGRHHHHRRGQFSASGHHTHHHRKLLSWSEESQSSINLTFTQRKLHLCQKDITTPPHSLLTIAQGAAPRRPSIALSFLDYEALALS